MADIDFVVALVDEVTAPARDIERGIEAVAKTSKASAKDIRKLSDADEELAKSLKEIGKQADAADAIEDFGKALGDVADEAGAAEGGLDGLVSGMGSFSKGVSAIALGTLIADIGIKLVGALADAATAFAGAALEGAEFARTTKNVLTSIAAGDAAKGAQDFAAILDVAKATKAPLEEVREGFVRLRQAGLSTQEAIDFSTIRQDVQAAGGEGDIFLDKMRDLAKEGAVSATIFEDVAEQLGGKAKLGEFLGLTPLAIENSQAGIEALDEELKQLDPEVFKRVAVEVAKSRGPLGELSAGARTVGESFDSIAEVSFAEAFGGFDLSEIFGPLAELVQPTLDAIIPLVQALVEGFGDALAVAMEIVGENLAFIGDILGTATGEGEGLKNVMRAIGTVLGVVVGAIALAVSGIAALIAIVQSVNLAIVEFIGNLGSLGSDVIDGLVAGVRNAGPRFIGALKGVVQGAINAAKAALGIGSPSKLFAEFGLNTGEGFAIGIEGTEKAVAAATEDALVPDASELTAASSPQGVSAGPVGIAPAAAGAVGGGAVSVEATINVGGSDDPAAVAQEVKTVFLSEVGNAIEQLATEVGA
jgi:hypothetical protein